MSKFLSNISSGMLLLTLVFSFVPSYGSAQQPPKVVYIYDDLGRLAKVVDNTTGECAIYNYDAVGNILSIARQTNCLAAPVVSSIQPGAQPGTFVATGQNLLGATIKPSEPGLTITHAKSSDGSLNFRMSGVGSGCTAVNATITTVAGSTDVTLPVSSQQTLAADAVRSDSFPSPTTVNTYCFNLLESTPVVLQAVGLTGSVQPCIELRTGSQTVPGGSVCANAATARVTLTLAAGNYTLLVSENGANDSGNYNLLLRRLLGQNASVLTAGATRTGSLTPTGNLDLYSFNQPAAGRTVLQAVSTSTIAPCVELYNAGSSQLVTFACTSTSGGTATIDTTLAVGNYLVLLRDFANTRSGGYSLSLQRPTTINVSCPAQSLQAAIDSAQPGDTIRVSGTCSENVVVQPEKVRVIIDGFGTAGVRAVINGSTAAPTIEVRSKNVSVQNLNIAGGQHGIAVNRAASAFISNNIIGTSAGSGILVQQVAYAAILSSTIQNHPKAGITVTENASARIGYSADNATSANRNTIQNNQGAGIDVSTMANATVVGNTIQSNAGAGVVVQNGAMAKVVNNTISSNLGNGIRVFRGAVDLGSGKGSSFLEQSNTGTGNQPLAVSCFQASVVGVLGSLMNVSVFYINNEVSCESDKISQLAVPRTTITSGPPSVTNNRNATFVFASDLPNSTFFCWIDGAFAANCTTPIAYTGLLPGPHKF